MEPKSWLPHLQVPVTCHYPEPNQYSPRPPTHFLKIRFNIILPSTPDTQSTRQSKSQSLYNRGQLFGRSRPLFGLYQNLFVT